MATIELSQGDNGGTRTAAVGDEVEVALEETATSGYRWRVESFDPAILQAADDDFTPPEPGTSGGTGQHRFRFSVVGPGTNLLRLTLIRAWDPGSVAESFETTIDAGA